MKCDNCKKYDDCAAGSGLVWPCGAYVPKVVTNADRIRAMSDEELRELFMFDTPCEMILNSGKCLGSPCNCRECILIWLQQPAEEG